MAKCSFPEIEDPNLKLTRISLDTKSVFVFLSWIYRFPDFNLSWSGRLLKSANISPPRIPSRLSSLPPPKKGMQIS